MANPHPPLHKENLRPPWPKGVSGNPKGRPKNTAKECMKLYLTRQSAKAFHELTDTEIDGWDNLLLSISVDDMQTLVKADNVPAYARALMMSILTEMKNGQSKTMQAIRDRQHGKPIKHELTGADGLPLIPERTLTPTEARQFLQDLENSV